MSTDPLTADCGRSEAELLALPLRHGSHGRTFVGECCLFEKANRIASCIPAFRERYGAVAFSDDHPSIARTVRALGMGLNDLSSWSSDEERTAALDRFAIASLGTNTTEADEITRGFMCVDWLVRVNAPVWLRLAGLTSEAQALESLARVYDAATADVAAAMAAMAVRAESAVRAVRAVRAESAARAAWGGKYDGLAVELRTSLIDLLDAMIAVGKTEARP